MLGPASQVSLPSVMITCAVCGRLDPTAVLLAARHLWKLGGGGVLSMGCIPASKRNLILKNVIQ